MVGFVLAHVLVAPALSPQRDVRRGLVSTILNTPCIICHSLREVTFWWEGEPYYKLDYDNRLIRRLQIWYIKSTRNLSGKRCEPRIL